MNNDLEQTLTGYERVQLTREYHARREFRKAEKYGAIRADIALEFVKDILKSLIDDNILEFRMIRASQFPCPNELRAFIDKHHPGEFERYWTESKDKKIICYDCISDVHEYKNRYFIFVRKSGGS